ncbi:MAG: ATP-binding protein [Nocardioides sp.]
MPAPVHFHRVGTVTDKIDVAISLQIIGLFSEGLYSSPNKAIEELVSNAFDADATQVHVAVSHDRRADDATIAVIDNGTGMGTDGLKIHWIVGDSQKARNRTTALGRRSIGKFGIGKLAAYVLGNRLTHLTKHDGRYYSTSMDFTVIPKTADVDRLAAPDAAGERQTGVQLDLRELTEAEARQALNSWLNGDEDRSGMKLFGSSAESSWTVAVISDLKDMASDLQLGRLRWVLSTALPLRDDFLLSLNEKAVPSSKIDQTRIGTWTLGKDVTELPRPADYEYQAEENVAHAADSIHRWSLVDNLLGPVTGYVEVFENPVEGNKSDQLGRSYGFFVYVHGRLINPEDAGFGIDRNVLRHGTFARIRVVIHMDRLDGELRSSRENLRDGPILIRSREILQALFNFARNKFDRHEASQPSERRAAQRLSESPASLAERPVLRMAIDTFDSQYTSRHLVLSRTDEFETSDELLEYINERTNSEDGIFNDVTFASSGAHNPIAQYDPTTGALTINQDHQFVAHFADEFGDARKNLPLQLLAVSEVILEAQLHDAGVEAEVLHSVLIARDELLRNLAKGSGIRNSLTVAQNLLGSVSSKSGLEIALVDAFDQLGFNAVPRGGKNKTDGVAAANLPPRPDGVERAYRVTLEAKSKETVGAKVKKSDVEVATIARHRKDEDANHSIVVGPDFVTGPADTGALIKEIDNDRAANPGRTITLMRASDLARLVRVAPVKRLNLEQIRQLFLKRSPDEAAAWVSEIEATTQGSAPYKQILEAVWDIQEQEPNAKVEFGYLRATLKLAKQLEITDAELRTDCLALSRMADNQFYCFDDRVELKIKPDTALDLVSDYVRGVPLDGDG